MKIAIVTLHGYFNFGNRLQNFALQEALRDMGHQTESIAFSQRVSPVKKVLKAYTEKRGGKRRLRAPSDIRRERKIQQFSQKYIATTQYAFRRHPEEISLNDNYDAFVVGSDQVWNPVFWGKNQNSVGCYTYLLRYAQPSKRIAYAASFGIEALPDFWKGPFEEALRDFRAISVRENAGAEIVSGLLGRQADVVLDPTMLLTAAQWEEKLSLRRNPERYVVTFFLGEPCHAAQEEIQRLKARGSKVVGLMDPHEKSYVSDPADFVQWIMNAEAVLTDSFHATVFSILFETPFITYDRHHSNGTNMNSRILTLLNTLGLSSRYWNGEEIDLLQCSFAGVADHLERERIKSQAYIRNALKVGDV